MCHILQLLIPHNLITLSHFPSQPFTRPSELSSATSPTHGLLTLSRFESARREEEKSWKTSKKKSHDINMMRLWCVWWNLNVCIFVIVLLKSHFRAAISATTGGNGWEVICECLSIRHSAPLSISFLANFVCQQNHDWQWRQWKTNFGEPKIFFAPNIFSLHALLLFQSHRGRIQIQSGAWGRQTAAAREKQRAERQKI